MCTKRTNTHMTTTLFRTILSAVLILQATLLFAQDSTQKRTHFYTGVYNELPEYSNFPVIGVVNICNGNQHNVQIGFTNVNQKNFAGAQIGFTNAIGGKGKGSQVGFANVCKDSFDGAAIGFVNLAGNRTDGAQIGFVNLSRSYLNGAQVGYINVAATTTEGAQIGFVNACRDSLSGMQIGFINATGGKADGVQVGFVNATGRSMDGGQVGFVNVTADSLKGVQVGFVNATTKHLNGAQVGFINIADSISKGIPVGFISFVRKGGFKAIEASYTEMYPFNLAFKTGVKAFYTTFIGSYNPDLKNKFALGAGIGSNVAIGDNFFFNPEALSQVTFEKHPQQIVSLNTLIGFTFAKRLSLMAGPDFVWLHKDGRNDNTLYKRGTSLYYEKLDARNSLHISAKAAFRITF